MEDSLKRKLLDKEIKKSCHILSEMIEELWRLLKKMHDKKESCHPLSNHTQHKHIHTTISNNKIIHSLPNIKFSNQIYTTKYFLLPLQ